MASILGSLLVELGINTAAFKGGLDKATYQAKQFKKELAESFHSLGEGISGIGEAFGGLNLEFRIRGVLSALEPLKHSFDSLGAAAAGLGIAAAGVGIGVIGIALHAVESAEKMSDLARSTGLSVEALSGLSLVGKTTGLNMEAMGKGLERMSKAAVTAAETGPKVTNPFTQLGIAVQVANGQMKSSEQLFADIAAKFETMADGPKKTALAMQIFGRAGAELIPLLDKGGEHISELIGHFQKLGAILDGPTAESAEVIKENMTLMTAAFTGVSNEILKGMAPALTQLTNQIVGGLEDSSSQMNTFVEGLVDVGKVLINVFQIVGTIIELIGEVFRNVSLQIQDMYGTVTGVWSNLKKGDFAGAWAAVKTGAQQSSQDAKDFWKNAVADIEHSVAGIGKVWTATLPKGEGKKGEAGGGSVKSQPFTWIDSEVYMLQEQATKALATAMQGLDAQSILASGHTMALASIEKLETEAKQKQVDGTQAFKNALAAAIPQLEKAAVFTAAFKAAATDQKGLDSFILQVQQASAALDEQSKSIGTVTRAQEAETAKLTPLKVKLDELQNAYAALRAKYGEHDKQVASLQALLAAQTAEYDKAVAAVGRYNAALANKAVTDETKKANDELAKLTNELAHIGDIGGHAFLDVDARLKQMAADTGLPIAAFDALRGTLEKVRDAQIEINKTQQAISAASSEYSKTLGYDPRALTGIQDTARQIQKDRAAGLITEQQYVVVMRQLNAQYADLQAKNGSFRAGINAALQDFIAETQSWGETMRTVVGDGLKGVEENFASMVTTGKANWKSLIDSMEQSLIKSALHNMLSSLFEKLGGGGGGGLISSIFGSAFGGGKDNGAATMSSAATKFSVATSEFAQAVSSFAMSAGGEGGGGMFGGLSSLFGGGDSEGSSGGIGGFLSGILGGFGGFFANGGDLSPGKSYIVGEKGPELFTPGASGTITPNSAMGGFSPTMVFQINGVTDADSFRKSQNQIYAEAQQKMMSAWQRNR